jgi:hypothetical protein
MAFRSAGIASVTTSYTTLYTGPANYEAVVHSLYLSNSDTVNTYTVSVRINIGGGVTAIPLVQNAQIPPGSSLIFDKPINMKASDTIQVLASAGSVISAYASILLTTADTVAP